MYLNRTHKLDHINTILVHNVATRNLSSVVHAATVVPASFMRLYWHLVTLDDYEMVAKMPSMQSKINNTVIRKETKRTCHNSNIEQRLVWIRGIALPMTNVQLGDFQKCFSMYCLFMFIYYYFFF